MIANTLPELFFNQADRYGQKIVYEYKLRRNEPYKTLSWNDLLSLVNFICYGLIDLGLKNGDKVAIISDTRYEWSLCDVALLAIGCVVVPVYPTLPDELVRYILNDSDSKVVIVENKGQLQKIRSNWDEISHVKYAVVIEDLGDIPKHDKRILTLNDITNKGRRNYKLDPKLLNKHLHLINANDLATVIYTSGTTGPPKGVMLSHENILSVLDVLPKVLPLNTRDKFLSFLPLSHVFERVAGLYYSASIGCRVSYCSGVENIGLSLKESSATVMLVVPRILEKIYAKIHSQIKSLPEYKQNLFKWAISCGKKYLNLKSTKSFNLIDSFEIVNYKIAKLLVFYSLKKKLAPKLKCFISGGAPLSKEIAEFFTIVGIPVLEGYGLTETSAPATVNTFRENKIGTVGKALPGVEIRTSNDGEILIKGPNVFLGYYKNESATKEAFREDSWFCTGDIGVIDDEGFLRITDRKKDIIVSSSGKNIAPQNIENAIKTSPYISNVVVIGDKRKYLSALVTLNEESVLDYIKSKGLVYKDSQNSLYKNPQVIKLIEDEIKVKTALFADYEQVRKFTILPADFTIESGEITPTLKIKRKHVEQKYKSVVDAMYPQE